MKRFSKTRYSKRIILYCLVIMTVLTLSDVVICFINLEQIDPSSLQALALFWGTEVFASAWIKVTESKHKDPPQKVDETTKTEQPEP